MANRNGYNPSAKEKELQEKIHLQRVFDELIIPQIPDYYEDYPVDIEYTAHTRSPVTTKYDSTPSLTYYPETNTWHCWSSGLTGGVVNLYYYFLRNHLGEEDTVRSDVVDFMYSFFIEGKETAKLKLKTDTKELLSSNKDMAIYSAKRSNAERILMIDKSVSSENKYKMYKMMDDTDCLVDVNRVNAVDALEYLRKYSRDLIGTDAEFN